MITKAEILEFRFNSIKLAAPILDVISYYEEVEKIDSYYRILCPFNKRDNSKQFHINPEKGIFFCYGCAKGGDVVSFIAKFLYKTQLQALRYLEKKVKLNTYPKFEDNKQHRRWGQQ